MTYEELNTYPISIYDLDNLLDYVLKWTYILENPKEFLVDKWLKENNYIAKDIFSEWLNKYNIYTNNDFIDIIGKLIISSDE